MRTSPAVLLFAFLFISDALAAPARQPHARARALMAEAKRTTNPVRLLMLGFEIKDALDAALKLAPDDVEVRLDLLRYHVVTPGIVGGSMAEAREHADVLAKHDAGLGHFANGYIAYREKEYGPARRELQEAAKSPKARVLALTWLGWLSQETQQYDTAFDAWQQLDLPYEIGRTAVFCHCRLEAGEAALKRYIAAPRMGDMPTLAEARYHLGLIHEKRGDLKAARREIEAAWRLDRSITGLKETRKRLGVR